MYKLAKNGINRLSDGAFIPENLKNRDWKGYLKWLDAGNTPEPESTSEELAVRQQEETNQLALLFLSDTDWKVTRHRDQLYSGVQTSLAESEFQALLTERQAKRDSIVEDSQ